ncbi:HlyD family secretion protein [Aetokthonos hydrillicola Thurmond2011]|jgi:membrane fusion protein (multidrug efflux system)|uniref:HlyD family secretion protein n=3 Tax=Aetokthonos TaxID=1550243 RepID=A0AAP5M7U8_9CYAN|nr:HlyD family secretion protein [Aetokthonos hydrillicola]MBO3459482.1 HlyD family secretion protein [Aetokthonos hydrillicola CCALA 1050]MBW4583845.1 HlyD family secretion protein [Aetokthonos hydrillicola CCALA 1050]MDR9895460.1 HlyD family secretion protein [Aetokthonos hydrillicola Thurmond2011]
MKPSNNLNELNGKGSAVQQRELDINNYTNKRPIPGASETLVRVEPLKTPEVEPEQETEEPKPEQRQEEPKKKPNKRKRLFLLAGGAVAAIAASIFGVHWWMYASTHQSTDDAYVTNDVHPVSSRINGTVSEVLVNDNQHVQAGQLLVRLDPRDYQVQLQQTQAALEAAQRQANAAQSNVNYAAGNALGNTQQAQGNVGSAKAAISTAIASVKASQAAVSSAQASVNQAQADLVRAQSDYNRYKTLYAQGVVPRQQLETAQNTYYVDVAKKNSAIQGVYQAQANLAQARENVTKAQAELAAYQGALRQAQATGEQTKVNQAQYQAALAQVDQSRANLNNASLQLSYTNIVAPSTGRVGNKSAQVGQRVQPGTPLMSITQDNPWVVANFKETQLAKMRIGQPVEVHIDAIPNHTFLGRVDSFSPGSGATFALLPSDNATGNFTKIVQRVPVKIVLDPKSVRGYESRIVPGLSVETSVTVK